MKNDLCFKMNYEFILKRNGLKIIISKSDMKRDFSLVKESFSNMSAPMISRENARCAILPISSLLAMLNTIPVLKNSL